MGYETEPNRAPTLQEEDTLLFCEHGRIIEANTYGHDRNGIDYRSHWFRIVKHWSRAFLLVKHGGGEERFELDYNAARAAQFFEPLNSNQRYLLMHMLYQIHSKARRAGNDETAQKYKQAFVDGRLKKRKMPRSNSVKIWIEAKIPDEVTP